MTNNPAKYGGLEGYGLDITERLALTPAPNPENLEYLRTKRERMGHLFGDLEFDDIETGADGHSVAPFGGPFDPSEVGEPDELS